MFLEHRFLEHPQSLGLTPRKKTLITIPPNRSRQSCNWTSERDRVPFRRGFIPAAEGREIYSAHKHAVSQLTLAFRLCFNGVKYQVSIEIKFPVMGGMSQPLIRIRTLKQSGGLISLLIAD